MGRRAGLRVVPGPPEMEQSGDLGHFSDEALLALASRADDDAFAELYDRYARVAYGLALRILRDPALAEDAVQDGFLAVWRSAGNFLSGRAKPSTWILTFVHRRAVDLVRREQRRRSSAVDSAPLEPAESAEDEAAFRSRRQIVQEALRQLPEEQREAIELAYYGGFAQSELADLLGQPLGTIKSRMFTGLRRLRDLLADAGIDSALDV